MSTPSFQLKRPLGRSYRVDLDDTRRTKQALQRLGYYETPDYGMTAYPDEPLFKAIESFQNDNDLPADGTIRPDDETAERLGAHLDTLPPMDGGGHPWRQFLGIQDFPRSEIYSIAGEVGQGRRNDPTDVQNTRRALSWAGFLPANSQDADETSADENLFTAIRNFQEAKGLGTDGWMHPGGETEWHLGQEIEPKINEWQAANQNNEHAPSHDSGDLKVAQSLTDPLILGTLGLIGAATGGAILGKPPKSSGETWDPGAADAGAARSSAVNPPPSVPPTEPPDANVPHKEEFPADPPDVPTFSGAPINEVIKNDRVVFQRLNDEVLKELQAPAESHRGDEHTQWGNAESVKICQKVFTEWGPDATLEHTGGSYKDGALGEENLRQKEAYFKREGENGSKGSSNADLSFKARLSADDEGQNLHVNTGVTRKDGSLVAGEERQLQNLAKNAAGELVDYLPKYRPWMDKDEWADRVETKCREIFTKHFGEPDQSEEE
jgi:peptidoglycan hydrolase-like protein with peptidoglycan-binding domain